MKYLFLITLLSFFQSSVAQIDSLTLGSKARINSKEFRDTYSLLYDTSEKAQYSLTKMDGYFLCYYYTNGNLFYNYNILFIPISDSSNKLLQNVVSNSKLLNKKSVYMETYQLPGEYEELFDKIFSWSWVVSERINLGPHNSLKWSDKYHTVNETVLFSKFYQFSQQALNKSDTLAIVFKLIKVSATLRLQAYNKFSQKSLFDIYYSTTDYYEPDNTKRFYVNYKMSWYKLDYRLISPILADVILVEFKDKLLRKYVKSSYEWERKQNKLNYERHMKRLYSTPE
jgi:hypothetical protein